MTYPLEVRSNRVDLVNKIFDRLNSKATKRSLDNSIISEWDSLSVNLSVATFVHQFLDGFDVRVSPGDVRRKLGSRLV